MRSGSWLAITAVLIASALPAVSASTASAASAAHWHCSEWVRIDKKVEVAVRSCIAVTRPAADAPNVLVKGKFEVRNHTASTHKVLYFPQAEGGSAQSPDTTSMGGAKQVKVPKHHTGDYTARSITLPRPKMWINVEYQLLRTHPAVRFRNSPHVKVGGTDEK